MTTTNPEPYQQPTVSPAGNVLQAPLRGQLGAVELTMMVIAAAAPLTVMGGAVILAIGMGNGLGLPWTFIGITAALLLFAVGFVAMTPYVKSAGAFYSYINLGLGRAAGLGAGYVALLSYLSVEAGLLGLLGSGLNSLFTSYGLSALPWWLYTALMLPLVLFFGHRNIALAGKVLSVLLLAEILIVLALDASVFMHGGGPEGFTTEVFNPANAFTGSPGIAVMFAVLSFIGFEAAAVFRDEAKDPARTVPRATYSSLIVVGAFYAISSWALISGIGKSGAVAYANKNTATMLNDVTEKYLGTVGAHISNVLFVTSVFICVLSFHNIASRYIHSLSAHLALPSKLGITNAKHGSPARASLTCGLICGFICLLSAIAGLDPVNQLFSWLGGITSVGVLMLMAMTCLATIVFFRRRKSTEPAWNTLIAPSLGLASLLLALGLVFANLPGLVGGSTGIAVGAVSLLVAAYIAGVAMARLRKGAYLN